jgi:aquaporin Z
MPTSKLFLAEALGTFFLCFAGIGAIVGTEAPIGSEAGLVGVALAHGLALSIAVSIFAGISGSHFNPAVTIGMLSTGRIAPPQAGMYIAAQLVGATVAAFCSKIDVWIVQIPCDGAFSTRAARSTRPTPFPRAASAT